MRLNKENIALIKNFKTKPNYNVSESKNTIIHFGVGNFHRAHQAFFIHEILNSNKDLSIYPSMYSLRAESKASEVLFTPLP